MSRRLEVTLLGLLLLAAVGGGIVTRFELPGTDAEAETLAGEYRAGPPAAGGDRALASWAEWALFVGQALAGAGLVWWSGRHLHAAVRAGGWERRDAGR